jgi:stage II sporulation protein D
VPIALHLFPEAKNLSGFRSRMPKMLLMTRRSLVLALLTACVCALFPGLASASSASKANGTFAITGGGFGHGIGMSQYGAMGFAQHGWAYGAILGHYYEGTSLAKVPDSTVTVLLGQGGATFTGADGANGKPLNPTRHYGVLVTGGRLELISGGHRSGPFSAPLRVSGAELTVVGKGEYAGSLDFYPSSAGGVLTVNAVGLEDYVRGVVSEEMPASWPQQALDAQAVAARSYVLANAPVSSQYDVYADTRSQMYGGISAETPSSNAAESATSGQAVEAGGRVVPTYFFSSSGGHTESIQNVWLGVTPAPYLVGVSDPYDDSDGNPYYRWSDKLSLATAASRLAGLYKGSFEGIKVLAHGLSPRIVSAAVIGSRGRSTVSGATLQEDLGTDSTWMSFTSVTARGSSSSGAGTSPSSRASASSVTSSSPAPAASAAPAQSATGGAGITALARMPRRVVSGSIFPVARRATVAVQLHSDGRWVTVGSTRVGSAGRYALAVPSAGVYRALYDGVAAPSVHLR